MEGPAAPRNGSAQKATAEDFVLTRRNRGKNGKTDSDENMIPEEIKTGTTERIFIARESPFTELFNNNPHLRTVYHLFLVILIILFLDTTVYDLLHKGTINVGQRLIIVGFGKIHIVAAVWICMQLLTLAALKLTKIWASVRLKPSVKGAPLKLWDISWIVLYLLGQGLIFTLPVYTIVHFEFPIASSNIVAVEMVRLMMKIHSFVRVCAPRILRSKKVGNTNVTDSLPELPHYVYFLFAPTLLYRDSYPRTTHIRKLFVLKHLLEVIGVVFWISLLCERFMFNTWSSHGLHKKNAAQLAADMFTSSLPGILTFLSGFYCLLHAWHNAFAELLMFADRQFYKEWWISSQFGAYYRTWNSVVHDWLRAHVYNEVLPIGGRNLATFSVFALSAIVHEVILSLALRFFYPVLLIIFGSIGMLLIPITQGLGKYSSMGNLGMWLSLVVGNGLLWSLYSMEYFARQNCDVSNSTWWKPVSWSCPEIVLQPDWKFTHPFADSSEL